MGQFLVGLIVFQLLKKSLAYCGTRSFIGVLQVTLKVKLKSIQKQSVSTLRRYMNDVSNYDSFNASGVGLSPLYCGHF
jgi:hypothetical protein